MDDGTLLQMDPETVKVLQIPGGDISYKGVLGLAVECEFIEHHLEVLGSDEARE
jgi:hypothetical protein